LVISPQIESRPCGFVPESLIRALLTIVVYPPR
jgi:hypothetical protein